MKLSKSPAGLLKPKWPMVLPPERVDLFMEMDGIEPTTCGLQSHRSPN